MDSLVSTYPQWCWIHKSNSCTCSQQYRLDEYGQRKQNFFFQLNKAIVWYPSWKQVGQMFTDIFLIKVFETSVTSWMKKNHDEHDFSITHTVGLVTVLPILWWSGKHVFFLIFRKFFAEIICQTINFSNFSLGEHSGNGLNVIIGYYKFKQIIAILLISNELFLILI